MEPPITPRRDSEIGIERLDLILHRMDIMRAALDETCGRINSCDEKLDGLRTDVDKMADAGPGARLNPLLGPSLLTSDTDVPARTIYGVPADDEFGSSGFFESPTLMGSYTQLRDSVQKVTLPAKMSFGDVGPNVKGDSRRMLTFVRKLAGYSSTLLKVLKVVSSRPSPEEADWDSVFTIALAMHKVLLSEQTVTVFEGSGVPQETLSMFRFLSKNSAISASETLALENAARLTTAINMSKAHAGPDTQRGRRGGFSGNRFGNNQGGFTPRGGRGYFNNSSYRGSRGDYRQSPDYFDSTLSAAAAAKP
jgi:hypothetical protein